MGIEALEDHDTGYSVMVCNTTMTAFGPVFYIYEDEVVMDFLDWHESMYPKRDVRGLAPSVLIDHVNEWRLQVEREKAEAEREFYREETAADHYNDDLREQP